MTETTIDNDVAAFLAAGVPLEAQYDAPLEQQLEVCIGGLESGKTNRGQLREILANATIRICEKGEWREAPMVFTASRLDLFWRLCWVDGALDETGRTVADARLLLWIATRTLPQIAAATRSLPDIIVASMELWDATATTREDAQRLAKVLSLYQAAHHLATAGPAPAPGETFEGSGGQSGNGHGQQPQ